MTEGYWKAIVAILSMSLMFAMLAHSGDTVDEAEYGNCKVWTEIDEFTDAVSHALSCYNYEIGGILELFNPPTTVALHWEGNGPTITFRTGDSEFLEDFFEAFSSISVVFRIDKGVVRKGEWQQSIDGSAVTSDRTIFDILLKELPGGKRIVFKIGHAKGIVVLNGSAKAVRDFQSRISK